MTARAVKSLGMSPGAEATSAGNAVRMRAETFAKMAAMIGAAFAVNFIKWGSIWGDDNTPAGALKLSETEDGKTVYIDTPASAMLRRGTRAVPLLSSAVDS